MQPVGAGNGVTLRDLGILADQTAEPVPAENTDICVRSGRMQAPGRRTVLQRRAGVTGPPPRGEPGGQRLVIVPAPDSTMTWPRRLSRGVHGLL